MSEYLSLILFIAMVFIAGWGWGQWVSERRIRITNANLFKGRVSVSMPMDADNNVAMMGLLQDLMAKAEQMNANPMLVRSRKEKTNVVQL